MTTLEATVEIVKAIVQIGGGGSGSSHYLLTDEGNRDKFLHGIEKLYKKLDDIDSDKLKS